MYLDETATTKPTQLALDVFREVSEKYWYNPSSMSEYSRDTTKLLSDSRADIAGLIGADPSDIFFTSGSTEGANWIMQGFVPRGEEDLFRIVVSEIEHPCVWNTAMYLKSCGVRVDVLHVDANGKVDPNVLDGILAMNEQSKRPTLVCVMDSNNEIGVIQDTRTIANVVHSHAGCFLFSDMTQSFAHSANINVEDLGVDFACASAQKFGGLKGVGFVYMKYHIITPLMYGGHQENGFRPGTENVAAIRSMAAQFVKARQDIGFKDKELLSYFLRTLITLNIPGVIFNNNSDGLPGILSVTLPKGCDANTVISLLDSEFDIQVSAGSACSSGENKPSRVLKAIGLSDDEARRTIRITVSKDMNTVSKNMNCEDFVAKLKQIVEMTKDGD